MAKPGGVNGALTIAGIGGDINGFDLEARQQVDDSTGYDETTDADHSGSGVRAWVLDFTAFVKNKVTGSSPGLAALSNAAIAVVATIDTGCTYTGNFVAESLRISHRKVAGTVGLVGRAYNKLAVAEAWAIS